jgi:predicted ArsR family transcriptional regulator
MLSSLIKKGVVGYEVLEVNGRPEKHYVVNQIGDERISGAKLYKKKGYE